jgi:hypothetical protein
MRRRRNLNLKLWEFKLPDLIQEETKKAPSTEMKINNLKNYLVYNGELVYSTSNVFGDIEVIHLQGTYYCLDKTKIPTKITEFNDKTIAIDYAVSISKYIKIKI